MTKLLPIISLGGMSLVLLILFMTVFKIDQNNWRTNLYLLVMLLIGAGAGTSLFYIGNDAENLTRIFLTFKIIFLVLGIIHIWWLYRKLFWSKRNSFQQEQDSFWPEFTYSLLTCFLITIGLLATYGYLVADFGKAIDYWSSCILFVIPFFFIKSYDLLNQIPRRDFSQRWVFTDERIGEDKWDWVNEIWVQFEVKENLISDWWGNGRKAGIRIFAPRKVPSREFFRLAVREYNKKGPSVSVQDLGFETENKDKLWWLFSIKFFWYRPNTWFRRVRYLDPYSSPVQNEVRHNDIIVARRMKQKGYVMDEEEIPMGEL